MRPDPGVHSERQRTTYRRLVRERGPDTGRDIDHLKLRSQGGAAEELLAAYERGAIPVAQTDDLSDRTNGVLFMVGVSAVGGTDTVG
jgi:hypothetical protein